jgi:uncharacterized Fe-S cluster-containing radical SAM superfamily enzyme
MVQTRVSLEEITFRENGQAVVGTLLQRYVFSLFREGLEAIAPFQVVEGDLLFEEQEKRVWRKLQPLLTEGLRHLRHLVGDKECVYIHAESGIPLIGSGEFGVIDRGTNILEVKPLTGCNLSCTFCSVNEGIENGKRDILVDEGYLVATFRELARLKRHPVEANIGPQGEPLLYPRIVALVRDLKIAGASVVSINTNGTLLTPRLLDELIEAGLDRINLSVHSLHQEKEDRLMGGVQDLSRLLETIKRCDGRVDVLLAPVLIPGVNDEDLDDLVRLAKTIKNRRWPAIGVQNYLEYPGGRRVGVTPRTWEEFYALLEEKGKALGVDLTLKGVEQEVFGIFPEATLEKPFRKDEVVKVDIRAPGRTAGEVLGVASGRVVTVRQARDIVVGTSLRVRLTRDKHNIFTAVPA